MPKVTDAEIVRTMQAIKAADGSTTKAAKALGLASTTVSSRVKIAAHRGLTADTDLEALETADQGEAIAPSQRQRFEDELTRLRRELRQAHRELNDRETLQRRVFELAEQGVKSPRWATGKSKSGTPGVPILFTSDFQWGEVVRADELDGWNEFNFEVARRRYRLLISKTIDLAFNHMVNPSYPGIIYLRGGDAISGSIHQELAETDERAPIGQVIDLAGEETEGIRKLAEAFGRVHVISIPGNHGRTTVKPQAKGYTDHNFETALAYMLEREFKDDKRVTFETPVSGDALFTVGRTNFLLTHGDRIGSRGGQGFIGPVATIARGVKKVREQYAHVGRTVHYVLLGHFHEPMMLPDFIVNGSLPGFSEFARGLRFKPNPPAQWLFFVHPQHSITARWLIYLESPEAYQPTSAASGWWAAAEK